MIYNIYTDGACSGNGKKNAIGGWAFVILNEKEEIIAQGAEAESNTTNQRMELQACLKACNSLYSIDPFANANVYSDSAYLINCFKQGWWRSWEVNGWKNSKKETVANQDLWKQIIPYFQMAPTYNFIKVKGHANNKYNCLVDEMAVNAVKLYEV